MVAEYERRPTDEERREFLKVLGVGSAAAVGSATLGDLRETVGGETATELAPVGQAIQSDLAGELDAGLLASGQAEFAERAAAMETALELGLPEGAEPREEFAQVAAAGRPVYDHLLELGFFESTTERLPAFTPEYVEDSVRRFVGVEGLTTPLEQLGFAETELVDLLATVVAHRRELGEHHWIATDELPRERIEFGEHIPPMTQGAAGGVLLWLESLDQHLAQHKELITGEILSDAVWDARTMAAGFQLMTEGAKAIAEESGEYADDELAALLSGGFALQTVGQNLLPQDAYWITEEMRDERRTDLETPAN